MKDNEYDYINLHHSSRNITKTRLFKYIENFLGWGGSNEYPQSMFWAEIRKIMYTPVNHSFTI